METSNIIRFLRSAEIQNNLDDAIKKLNLSENKSGQPIVVFYYTNPEKTKIDCIQALGLSNGKGPETYSIISSESSIIVSEVIRDLTEIPDISQSELIWQQTFVLYKEDEKQSYWVYREGGERVVEKVEKILDKDGEEIYVLVKESTTGILWWVGPSEVKKAYDFNTREEFNELSDKVSEIGKSVDRLTIRVNEGEERLDELEKAALQLKLSVKIINPKDLVIQKGEIIPVTLNISTSRGREDNDTTKDCSYKLLRVSGEKTEITLDEKNNYTILGVSESETFTVFAVYNKDTYFKDEKTVFIEFVEPSFFGKIEHKSVVISEGRIILPWELGKPLVPNQNRLYGPNWTETDIKNFLSGNYSSTYEVKLTTNPILLGKNEEFNFSEDLKITDHLFFARPKEFGDLLEILDGNLGINILEGFEIYREIPIAVNEKEVLYTVYVKKQPSVDNNVNFIFRN